MKRKKLSRREFLRMSAVTAAGAALAGCAPQVVKETIIVEKPVEKVVEKVVTATPAPSSKEVVPIIFLSQETDPTSVAVHRQNMGRFEAENPDIRIEIQYTGPDQIIETMVASLAAGTTALDVFQPNPAMGFLLGASGQTLPLNDLVEEMGGEDNFLGNDLLKYKGEIYGVPFGGGVTMIWYRKDLFEADGIPVPDTLEEFEEAAKHFTKAFNPNSPTEFGITLPLGQEGPTQLFGKPFMWIHGAEIFDKDLNVTFDSDETVEAVEWYSGMAKYTSEAATGYGWGDMIDTFLTEKSAMTFYLGRVLGRTYLNAPHLVDKISVFPYPKKKLRVIYSDPSYYSVNRNTAYPEQAKRWLKFLLTGQPSFDFLCTVPTHITPITREQLAWWNQDVTGCQMLDENPEIKSAVGDMLKYGFNPLVTAGGVLEAVKQGAETWVYTGVANPMYAAVSAPNNCPWTLAVQNVVVSGMSPRDAVKAVAPEISTIVNRMKEEVGWEE